MAPVVFDESYGRTIDGQRWAEAFMSRYEAGVQGLSERALTVWFQFAIRRGYAEAEADCAKREWLKAAAPPAAAKRKRRRA